MSKKIFIVGRDEDCEIPIADESVSRKHAEIELTSDGNLFVVDCNSMNKTFIVRGGKSEHITQAVAMLGDSVRFGTCEFAVRDLIDMVLAKTKESSRKQSRRDISNLKMVRCEQCGNVKPEGEICPQCNTKSRRA